MSGKDNRFSDASNKMKGMLDKLKRSVSEADDNRDPLQRGYSRVETAEGSLSTSSTSTSLDTVLIENVNELIPLPRNPRQHHNQFTPISEGDETNPLYRSGEIKSSKPSLKSSKVSFEQKADSSDEDSFEDRRDHFQQRKAKSADHKGILKDLTHLASYDNRKAFQSKKHVSLDIKNSKRLEQILKGGGSSDEEEFAERRRQFQARKHQSLDNRVKFNLEKKTSSDSSEEEFDAEGKRLIHERVHDFSKPIVIDINDLDVSDVDEDEEEDEADFVSTRKSFQQQRSLSTDSRKSHRFFEMDDMGGKQNENLRTAVPFIRQITQDGKPKLEVYRPTTNPIYIKTQCLAAIAVSLGSLVVGFSSGYTSPALPSMKDRNYTSFEVTEDSGSWVGGVMPLAGLIGGVLGGPLIELLGRKMTILATSIPFIISWLLIACAVNIWMVIAGRAITGFVVGVASLSLPVYLGETIQPEVRGTLGLLPTAFGNIGILLCFVAGRYMNWSSLAFLGGTLPVPFLILMVLIPETPRWYISKGKQEPARKALQWLRGKAADVEPELKGIVKSHTDSEKRGSNAGIAQLFTRCNLKPLSISLGLMFFQQFSGINAVIFYAEKIFIDAGSTIEESICVIIIGVVNFVATFIATILIDRLGRKILLYISSIGMIITLGALGGYFYVKDSGENVSHLGWLPLASLMGYVLCFSIGYGPIPWLMMGEILPAKIRGAAASVATGFNWTCTFIITKTFSDIIRAIGMGGCFWFFGAICIIGFVFEIFCVPETQGKSLEEIERKMMGRVRRMSSVANIRPLSFNM